MGGAALTKLTGSPLGAAGQYFPQIGGQFGQTTGAQHSPMDGQPQMPQHPMQPPMGASGVTDDVGMAPGMPPQFYPSAPANMPQMPQQQPVDMGMTSTSQATGPRMPGQPMAGMPRPPGFGFQAPGGRPWWYR